MLVSERVPLAELPPSVRWVAHELGLVDNSGQVLRDHIRTLGEFLVRFGNTAGAPVPVPAVAAKRTRVRTKPTKAEVQSEITRQIAEYLRSRPGSTLTEIAAALKMGVPEVTAASKPVDWLVLGEDELVEPTLRIESDAIAATRDRARAALQAANLMVAPLSHHAYTTLLRNGRVKGPSVARIVQLFGSWTAACSEVGVVSGEELRSNYERRWTEEDLFGYVERFLLQPSYRGASAQFDTWRSSVTTGEKVPSLGTVRNIIGGTWNDIRTATLRRMRQRWSKQLL
jgi:hypothetical protein